MVSEEFAERLKQPKSATKNDIVDFVKEVDFDEKLKKKVTSNKTKLVEGWKETLWSNKKSCTNIRKRLWFFVRYKLFYR